MVEYIVRTDKPERLNELLHLQGIPHYEVTRLRTHGRLIDADAFKAYLLEWLMKFVTHPNFLEAKKMTEDFFRDIDEAPTVLEASDNNDDDHSYEMQSDMRDYCERYEPTYNPEDGSM